MNKNSNTYIITYAAIMVVIVAAVLSFAALSLKPIQSANVRIEKMSDILRSIGEGGEADKVPNKAAYITEMYQKYIVESFVINPSGDKIEGVDAFTLLTNLKAEYDKPEAERQLPVFVSRNDAGVVSYVIPVYGAGLWGPVWGYVALADNWDTVLGVVFDHKSETPGLGAEISTATFQAQFKGKQILRDGAVVSIALQKGGAADDDPYAVDAVSGGTLTSRGVESMLKECLSNYDAFIRKQLSQSASAAPTAPAEHAATDTTATQVNP
ncbi:MAG: NADH:ubiquinone reductase (Na(+)-transporting) subunit C [Alistipes sp.]|nr:NADH:ubiquinone reductase (Na(+)-transporting) subunit C [Alistipes sp.]